MNTRTLTLTFTGATFQDLPGGVFLFIKSATAAIDITLTDPNGTQSTLLGVGAGARQKRPGQPWRYTRVTSSVAQVVVIVISDDAEFDIANTVTVSGNVTTQDVPATSIADTADTTQASGTETSISANASRRWIKIGVLSTSGNGVRVSQAGGANTRGEEIQPGMSQVFPITAALIVRNANIAGDGSNAVWWAEEFA